MLRFLRNPNFFWITVPSVLTIAISCFKIYYSGDSIVNWVGVILAIFGVFGDLAAHNYRIISEKIASGGRALVRPLGRKWLFFYYFLILFLGSISAFFSGAATLLSYNLGDYIMMALGLMLLSFSLWWMGIGVKGFPRISSKVTEGVEVVEQNVSAYSSKISIAAIRVAALGMLFEAVHKMLH